MHKNEKIFSRIKRVRGESGLTQEDFAAKVGLTRGNYSQIEIGKQLPRLDTLSAIARNFNISYEWLIDGVGEMNAQLNAQLNAQSKNVSPNVTPSVTPNVTPLIHEPSGKYVKAELLNRGAEIVTVVADTEGNSLVPVLDITAAAGLPQNINNAQYFKDRSVFSIPWPQFRAGDYVIIQITGDSMHPTVYHGDWVFAKRLYDFKDIKDSYVHIVVTRDAVLCKRLYDRIQKKRALTLASDNEAYPNYDEPIDNILAIYKVEHRLTAVLRNENTDIKKELHRLQDQVDAINKRLNELK